MPGKLQNDAVKYLPAVVFVITAAVYLPVIKWLLGKTIHHDQLLHAFIVMLLTGGLLIYEGRNSLSFKWQFTDTVQNLLVVSYGLLVVAFFVPNSLIILMSFTFTLGAFLWFMWGREQCRFIISGLVAFYLFAAIALFLPLLDWPLRTFAGKWAALGLSLAGQNVELNLIGSGEGPMLMLINNNQPFHVAAECNGFGMLGSCLLMATFILLYRKLNSLDRIGWLIMSVVLGLFFNILRIMVIVLAAAHIPRHLYYLMHEAVGIITTYGGLLILYFLLMPRTGQAPDKPGSIPENRSDLAKQ